jgi:hypothetical protein
MSAVDEHDSATPFRVNSHFGQEISFLPTTTLKKNPEVFK